jgi:16S rRNA (guanine527-N7)-methyltransferase
MNSVDLLEKGIEELGMFRTPDILRKLTIYLDELERWNPSFGLVNASGQELVIKHILDSLAGAPLVRARKPSRLADIGSGAGFPGVPLAAALPETHVTLVEPSQKRTAFLRGAVSLMGLRNVRIFEGELERVRERFDCVTLRAFKPLDRKILRRLSGILAEEGFIAAYKGRMEKIEEELAAARALGFAAEARPLRVPFLKEPRHLVYISNPPFSNPPS